MKLARIKPFNPRKGLTVRSFALHGVIYRVERGWYEVDDATASYLANVHCDSRNDESPLAFDVCTREQAEAMEEAERRKEREKAEAADPIRIHRATRDDGVLRTSDLPSHQGTPNSRFVDEGDEGDLESEDLAADVAAAKPAAPPPGSPAARASRSRRATSGPSSAPAGGSAPEGGA